MDLTVLYVLVLFMLVSFHRLTSSPSDTLGNSASMEMKTSADCPATSDSTHGHWSESVKDGGIECELRCDGGYEPDKCNVLIKTGNGTWNRHVPNCIKEPWAHTICGKLIISAVIGVGAGAVDLLSVRLVIWLVGFTCSGVRKGSAAAYFQVPNTEAGSCFARCQSTGAKGCSLWFLIPLFVVFTVVFTFAFVLWLVLRGDTCL